MWKTFINFIKEILFEKRCVICKRKGEVLCDDCFSLIEILEKKYNCNPALDELLSATSKENKYILRVLNKYNSFLKELAIPLTKLLSLHLKFINKDYSDYVILPLKKKKDIGYDPNYELGLLLSFVLELPLITEYNKEEKILLLSDAYDDLLIKKAIELKNNGAKYITGITITR